MICKNAGRKSLFISSALAILVMIGTVALLHYLDGRRKSDQTAKSAQVNVTSQTPASAEWKTYQDEDAGFEVTYPAGYAVHAREGCVAGEGDSKDTNVIIQAEDPLTAAQNGGERIHDFDVFVNDATDACLRNRYTSTGGSQDQSPKLLRSETVKIGAYSALKRTYAYLDASGDATDEVFSTWRFKKGGTTYTLLHDNGLAVSGGGAKDVVFQKFLESFRFFEKAAVRIVFTPPTGLIAEAMTKNEGNMTVVGWSTGATSGEICRLSALAGTKRYACEVTLRMGDDLYGQIEMHVPSGLGGCSFAGLGGGTNMSTLYWGDRSHSPCGGNGHLQGQLSISVDGVRRDFDLRSTTSTEPCTGEYCNFHVKI